MKRVLLCGVGIFLLLMLFVNIVFALSIEEIAKNFRERYKKTNNFSADFEETKFVAGRKHIARGKLSFQKPNLLRQEYFDPSNPENMTVLIVSDGQTLWSYTPLINQVIKQKVLQNEGSLELLPGFGRSMENVEKNYSLSLVKDELAEKNRVHAVELIPKVQDEISESMFDTLQVWIRDEDSVPVQFMYKHKKNEMTFILSFKNVKLNEDLDKSTFEFEVPKGVQVITVPDR